MRDNWEISLVRVRSIEQGIGAIFSVRKHALHIPRTGCFSLQRSVSQYPRVTVIHEGQTVRWAGE